MKEKDKKGTTKKEESVKEVNKIKKNKLPDIIENNAEIINENARRLAILATIMIVVGTILLIYSQFFAPVVYKTIEVKENNPHQKTTFTIGNKIIYKGVSYTINKVETSKGTSYRPASPGNQYIIVTILVKNESDKRVEYSYKNWKMTNETGDIQDRILVPIQGDSALYSGTLVASAQKKGTLVYEQPIDATDLRLNFYEIKENPDSEEETGHKVFSIIIDIAKNKS